MAYLIGTDEAGYGPNLGPLVISATAWRVPDQSWNVDLYESLSDVITGAGGRLRSDKLWVADSKQLYKPGAGLAALESGLFPMLRELGVPADSWASLWDSLAPDSSRPRQRIPWYRDFVARLPIDAESQLIESLGRRLSEQCGETGIRVLGIRSTALFPAEFNALTEDLGSKGELLSRATLALIRGRLEELEPAAVRVVCDKHGGRSRYAGLIQHCFPEAWIQVIHEQRAESLYRWTTARGHEVECYFRAKGESFLPSALASMASKYLRELAMRAFNDYWCGHVPGLRRTAGYPTDAKRFKLEISAAQTRLKIPHDVVWRNR